MMYYIPREFQITNEQFNQLVNTITDETFIWMDILKVDYNVYNSKDDYDGGLSFIDRLNKKLGRFHPEWDIESFKTQIRFADSPQETFILVISTMLADPRDVNYYGF